MRYQFAFRLYQRLFCQPLHTAHGVWRSRQGIILQLQDEQGQVGFGEIAPLAWFGSESLAAARSFCQCLPDRMEAEEIFSIPDELPATQFGFESAWEMLQPPAPMQAQTMTHSVLLPTGAAALKVWPTLWQADGQTFKWKIGTADFNEEIQWFERLCHDLPEGAKLRLDANGGLSWEEACQWLERCDRLPQDCRVIIEFLEQPLPPTQFDQLLKLSQGFQTAIALDESVATLAQLQQCVERGWKDIVVIKAAIAGSPIKLREYCQRQQLDVVWSSVFETAIAQRYIQTCLMPMISCSTTKERAMGWGINHWFQDALFNQSDFEQIWQTLSLSNTSSISPPVIG